MESKWKEEEIQYLINNRDSMKAKELSEKLHRSIGSIQGKIQNLRLKKKFAVSIGAKINRLTITNVLESGLYECLCKCGKTIEVEKGRFYGPEAIKSCGCHKKIAKQLISIKDILPEIYSFRFLYARYLNNAKVGRHLFTLDFEQFIDIVKQNCSYCGIEPRPFNAVSKQKTKTEDEKQKYSIFANGIDRVNSDIGYTAYNTVTACKECNYAKKEMSLNEWNSYLDRICNFRLSKKTESLQTSP